MAPTKEELVDRATEIAGKIHQSKAILFKFGPFVIELLPKEKPAYWRLMEGSAWRCRRTNSDMIVLEALQLEPSLTINDLVPVVQESVAETPADVSVALADAALDLANQAIKEKFLDHEITLSGRTFRLEFDLDVKAVEVEKPDPDQFDEAEHDRKRAFKENQLMIQARDELPQKVEVDGREYLAFIEVKLLTQAEWMQQASLDAEKFANQILESHERQRRG